MRMLCVCAYVQRGGKGEGDSDRKTGRQGSGIDCKNKGWRDGLMEKIETKKSRDRRTNRGEI